MKKLLILSAALMLCACTANANETTPIGLTECIQRIKEKDLFKENYARGFAYTYSEAKANETDYDKVYFVDVVYENVYGEWFENWFCGVTLNEKKEAVSSVSCTRETAFNRSKF